MAARKGRSERLSSAAQAKSALLMACTEEDIEAVINSIRERARNAAAEDHREYATLFLSYTVGRPRQAPSDARMVSIGDLSSLDGCVEALIQIEKLVCLGSLSPEDAEKREARVKMAADIHRAKASEKALEVLEGAGALPFYGEAGLNDDELAARFKEHLGAQRDN